MDIPLGAGVCKPYPPSPSILSRPSATVEKDLHRHPSLLRMSGTDRSGFERSVSSWYSGFLLPQFQGPDLLRKTKATRPRDFFESDFPLTVGVVAESLVVMRGSGLPLASIGARDPVVRFHEGHSPPLPDQMAFHSESGSLVGQVRFSLVPGSWWCFFLVAISVILGRVDSSWAGDPPFLDFNIFAADQSSWNIKKSLSVVNSLPYPIIQPAYSFAVTSSPLNMSNPQRSRPCPYSRPVRFAVAHPYPPPPYQPVASHRYGLRPRLPLTNGRIAVTPRTRTIPEDVVMASPTFIPAASPAAPVLSPVRAAFRSSSGMAGPSNLRAGLGNPFTPRTPVTARPIFSVATPAWSFRVNRPDPFSPSSPANPFAANPTTPGSPIVRPRPSVGGSRVLSNLTWDLMANRVVIDRRESPPPAPRPRNLSSPPPFESSPLAARWSSPSTDSATAGSTTGTPAPARVATPPVQGAYDPDDYHLLQRDQICLLLAPAPPPAPYDRYRFGSRADAPESMSLACDFVAYCHDFPTFDQAQIDRRVAVFENWALSRRGA
ncbi:hypothetical protein H4Q26_009346 [Puccinia striiformis f. sp. tritici PST-130]|nr:hypothetical protein H4Q26_009346 [Puccinia striiformis f. sp. tritici PST-130]